MDPRPIYLLLDSLAIGIVVATIGLEAMLLLNPGGMGDTLGDLGFVLLTAIWLQLSVFIAPFGTLILLAANEAKDDG